MVFVDKSKASALGWQRAVVGSLLAHGTLAVSVATIPSGVVTSKPVPITVRMQTPPTAVPTPLPQDDPIFEEPKVVRKPRPRDAKVPQPVQQKPEIRAGLSESTTTNATSNIAVPLGNSAEVKVDPSKASLTPPVTLDEDVANAVSENVSDSVAKCSFPAELAITDEAVNAGITSGQVIIEVIVGRDGRVREPVLKKGVGYGVDELALAAARKLKCTPAERGGVPVSVKNKKLVWTIVY